MVNKLNERFDDGDISEKDKDTDRQTPDAPAEAVGQRDRPAWNAVTPKHLETQTSSQRQRQSGGIH